MSDESLNIPDLAYSGDLTGLRSDLDDEGFLFSDRFGQPLVVYTDGCCFQNGYYGAQAGIGVFWGDWGYAEDRNLSERLPGSEQTNNRAELWVSPGLRSCVLCLVYSLDCLLFPASP